MANPSVLTVVSLLPRMEGTCGALLLTYRSPTTMAPLVRPNHPSNQRERSG